jgi:hypothetical protein
MLSCRHPILVLHVTPANGRGIQAVEQRVKTKADLTHLDDGVGGVV